MRAYSVIERITENPAVYDLVQRAFGYADTARRLEAKIAEAPGGRLLDVGAGTGTWATLARPTHTYVALDVDPLKLERLRAKHPSVETVKGDACALPFADGSFEDVLCVAVSHHLDDAQLATAFAEMARVATRRLVFLDALKRNTFTGRLLWAIDRGAHPRSLETLRTQLERRFRVTSEEVYTHRHTYVLWTAERLRT
jgi:ubiquinone/menaquinone biosynthesis C-methylase UbiE